MAVVYTQADLDALKEALVTGASEVQIGDRRIKYRTQAEIEKLITKIEAKLSETTSTQTKTIQAKFSKGQT